MDIVLQILSVAFAALAAYYARDTVRLSRLERVHDGWRQVAQAVHDLDRAARRIFELEELVERRRDLVRVATDQEWIRLEGRPDVFRAQVELDATRDQFRNAQDSFDRAVAGNVRTPRTLTLRLATALQVRERAPAVLAEIHDIQDRLLRDPAWWFRNPIPIRARAHLVLKRAWDEGIASPFRRICRVVRAASAAPWKGFA